MKSRESRKGRAGGTVAVRIYRDKGDDDARKDCHVQEVENDRRDPVLGRTRSHCRSKPRGFTSTSVEFGFPPKL